MRRRTRSSNRVLPDGTPLRNRLLSALPAIDYKRIATHLRLQSTVTGDTLRQNGHRLDNVYFPNGGVFSVTNRMRDGTLRAILPHRFTRSVLSRVRPPSRTPRKRS